MWKTRRQNSSRCRQVVVNTGLTELTLSKMPTSFQPLSSPNVNHLTMTMVFCPCLGQKSEAAKIDARITRWIEIENRRSQLEYKILLLGTGEAGKSTFLRQVSISPTCCVQLLHRYSCAKKVQTMRAKWKRCVQNVGKIDARWEFSTAKAIQKGRGWNTRSKNVK
jgi:hypothetical protein